jgi:hypothetical protein
MIPILPLRPGETTEIVCLCPETVGVYSHWFGNRSMPCTGSDNDCLFDHRQTSARWQGWISCVRLDKRIPLMFALTPGAALALELTHPAGSWRGRHILIGRTGTARNGKMNASFALTTPEKSEVLPGPINATWWLLRMWGPPAAWGEVRKEQRARQLKMQSEWLTIMETMLPLQGVSP